MLNVNPLEFVNKASHSIQNRTYDAPTDTRCAANTSRRRAEREIEESIEDEGGCQGDDEVASDCICVIGDYACFCCGECG